MCFSKWLKANKEKPPIFSRKSGAFPASYLLSIQKRRIQQNHTDDNEYADDNGDNIESFFGFVMK